MPIEITKNAADAVKENGARGQGKMLLLEGQKGGTGAGHDPECWLESVLLEASS